MITVKSASVAGVIQPEPSELPTRFGAFYWSQTNRAWYFDIWVDDYETAKARCYRLINDGVATACKIVKVD